MLRCFVPRIKGDSLYPMCCLMGFLSLYNVLFLSASSFYHYYHLNMKECSSNSDWKVRRSSGIKSSLWADVKYVCNLIIYFKDLSRLHDPGLQLLPPPAVQLFSQLNFILNIIFFFGGGEAGGGGGGVKKRCWFINSTGLANSMILTGSHRKCS